MMNYFAELAKVQKPDYLVVRIPVRDPLKGDSRQRVHARWNGWSWNVFEAAK